MSLVNHDCSDIGDILMLEHLKVFTDIFRFPDNDVIHKLPIKVQVQIQAHASFLEKSVLEIVYINLTFKLINDLIQLIKW